MKGGLVYSSGAPEITRYVQDTMLIRYRYTVCCYVHMSWILCLECWYRIDIDKHYTSLNLCLCCRYRQTSHNLNNSLKPLSLMSISMISNRHLVRSWTCMRKGLEISMKKAKLNRWIQKKIHIINWQSWRSWVLVHHKHKETLSTDLILRVLAITDS